MVRNRILTAEDKGSIRICLRKLAAVARGWKVRVLKRFCTGARLRMVSRCLADFGTDSDKNIQALVTLFGELVGAACAMYNRLDKGMLCSLAHWNVPADYNLVDEPEGHICYDVIRRAEKDVLLVRHLQQTRYYRTDPNVAKYGLQTYVGKVVRCAGENVGSLCAVYREDFVPGEADKLLMEIIASTIGLEEERKRKEAALQERMFYEKMLSDLSVRAVASEDLGVFQDFFLKTLGKTLDVSRSYIFEYRHQTGAMDNTFEWSAPGISPQKENMQGVPMSCAPWWMEMMRKNQIINFRDIQDIPSEPDKEILKAQDIRAILVVPLCIGKEFYGFMGFVECRRCRDWRPEDVDVLVVAGQILSGVVARERAGEELRLSREQLLQSQKIEALGRLAGGIAHDFNNLLTSIQGYCDFLLRSAGPGHPMREDLQEIEKASARASSLTRQLLVFGRKQEGRPEILNLNDILQEMGEMLGRLLGENMEVAFSLSEELGFVKADPRQVEQVVMNLAINARDAMPKGGRLTLKTENMTLDRSFTSCCGEFQCGPHVMLEVKDTGVGMDLETRSHLFEPFFTTKDFGKGTGLGLSIVYGIVHQNGGHISVQSEPGQGASFKIYLPLVQGAVEPAQITQPESRPARCTGTVLLVEDEHAVRGLVRRILLEQGYVVLDASGGEEALELCRRHEGPIHLMVTDVVMPGMRGTELYRRLVQFHPEMRVLYMSGYTNDVLFQHGGTLPGALLRKPFKPEELALSVRRVLSHEVQQDIGRR